MAPTGKVEYHVFADVDAFGKAGFDPVGTITENRSGTWYNGRLLAPPEPGLSFGAATGVQQASDTTLRIADGPTGVYRAFVVSNNVIGTTVALSLVMRQTTPGGSVTEVIAQQTLTVAGVQLTRAEVQLRCVDLEDKKLDALYPPLAWNATDWPQLRDTDAGKPICYPVGTALKLPAPQLASDDTNLQYFFGVCTGVPQGFTISSVIPLSRRITVFGDLTGIVDVGQVIYVTGSSAIDGRLTVTAITYGASSQITVAELLGSSSGGSVRVMPHVLTVYRNGRVVDPSEYSVVHAAARPPLANGDFATGTFSGWTVVTSGGGTATVTGGKAVLTLPGGAASAQIKQNVAASKDLWYSIAVDVDAASTVDLAIGGASADLTRTVADGARRGILARRTVTDTSSITFNPAVAGSVTLDNIALGGTDLVLLLFALPQVDFQGNAYVIEADVRGIDSRNAADEVARLLGQAGVATESFSFTTAAGVASANAMFVDCDYGRAGQRTIRAIIEDHLYLLRAGLYRGGTGLYGLVQDKAGSVVDTLDESLADSLDVDNVQWPSLPASVSLRYRPGAKDPSTLQNTIKRSVSGGLLGDEQPRDMPYVRDHETADRLLCYLALRRARSGTCAATVYRKQFGLSDVLNLGSPLNWGATPRNWIVRGIARVPNANKLSLMEYDASVYTYFAAVLPGSARGTDYLPDYSSTPPLAPTALKITTAVVALAPDGTSNVYVKVQCVPPVVNWAQVWFTAIHNVTGEVIIAQGASIGGGNYGVTLTGLRAGNVYQLKAYAVNAFNIQGALQATFDATAIGGGAAVTTFTTPGYAVLPPNVSSCTANQGTGLIVQVSWPAVSLSVDVLGDYILERKTGLGSFAEVWRGRANSYTDRDFTNYLTTAQYRVRASDRWGNLSAGYATSTNITLVPTIHGGSGSGGDVGAGTVDTYNRTGVTTVSRVITFGGSFNFAQGAVGHSLGKVPVATCVGTGGSNIIATITAMNSTTVTVLVVGVSSSTDNFTAIAGTPHQHTIGTAYGGTSVTVSVDIW